MKERNWEKTAEHGLSLLGSLRWRVLATLRNTPLQRVTGVWNLSEKKINNSYLGVFLKTFVVSWKEARDKTWPTTSENTSPFELTLCQPEVCKIRKPSPCDRTKDDQFMNFCSTRSTSHHREYGRRANQNVAKVIDKNIWSWSPSTGSNKKTERLK